MHICIFQTGEPLHIDKGNYRPMRCMLLADKLIENGHKVSLISSSFFHQRKIFRFKSYKSIKVNKNLNIYLIPSIGYKNHIGIKRIIDHIILALNLHIFLKKKEKFFPDKIFLGYPPIETSLVMILWGIKKKIPIILDVKDNWPENFIEVFPNSLKSLAKLFLLPYFLIAKFIFKNSYKITSITDSFIQWIKTISEDNLSFCEVENKYFVSPLVRKPIKLTEKNYYDSKKFWLDLKINVFEKKHFSFIGSLTKSFDFNFIYFAAKYLLYHKPEYKFIICGLGDQKNELEKLFFDLENVILVGEIDQYQSKLLISNSIATLAPYKNNSNFNNSIPNKIIESLENNVPFITNNYGELKKMIDNQKNGIYVPNYTNESLSVFLRLVEDKIYLNQLKENAHQSYEDLFNFDKIFENIINNFY